MYVNASVYLHYNVHVLEYREVFLSLANQ